MDAHVLKELTYEDFQFVYQPIYALNSWETLGFEALLRQLSQKGKLKSCFHWQDAIIICTSLIRWQLKGL